MENPDYQPFYCEENIWKLCDHGVPIGSQVIFSTTAQKEVLLLQQTAGDKQHGLVVWDYHVILAQPKDGGWQIRDLDSRLNDLCKWPIYREQTFPRLSPEYETFTPMFRILPASQFHERFASDRSHMRDADGGWLQSPPSWPAIGKGSNLNRFIDLEQPFLGNIVDLDSLLR